MMLVVMAGTVARAQDAAQDTAQVTAQVTPQPQDAHRESPSGPEGGSWPSQSMTRGAWEFGGIVGGGADLTYSTDTHFLDAGVRLGLILSGNHGKGWSRGNFEWAVELLPVYTVFTPQEGAVYGGSFKPVIWRWNFTSGKKIAPYASIAGGILFSTNNIPPGVTSWVNFTPQAAVGANIFRARNQALIVEASYVHHSSAGLGEYNPGYNGSFFFTVGYTWFRGER
jgi:hypothetical protein